MKTKFVYLFAVLMITFSFATTAFGKEVSSTWSVTKTDNNGCKYTIKTTVVWDDEVVGYIYRSSSSTTWAGGKGKNGKPCPSGLLTATPWTNNDRIRTSFHLIFGNENISYSFASFYKPISQRNVYNGTMLNGCRYETTTITIYDDKTGIVSSSTTTTRFLGGKTNSKPSTLCPRGLITFGSSKDSQNNNPN